MNSSNAPKIFLSHSANDKVFVQRLAHCLRNDHFAVWFDEWEINVGDSIVDKVNEGLSSSDFLLIVLSRSSVQSRWVKQELNAATMRACASKGVFILPVLIEECAMPPLLVDKLYADFSRDFSEAYKKLRQAVVYHYSGLAFPIAGRWIGEMGHLDLAYTSKGIAGQYTHNSQNYIGKLRGFALANNLFSVSWRWTVSPGYKGKGYLFIADVSTQLIGGWWFKEFDRYINKDLIRHVPALGISDFSDLADFNRRLVRKTVVDTRLKNRAVNDWRFLRPPLSSTGSGSGGTPKRKERR